MYISIQQANEATFAFGREGGELSDRFLTHIKDVLTLFHAERVVDEEGNEHKGGDHNIDLLNNVLVAAGRMRLQRTKMAGWLSELTGHMQKQDKNKAAILGKKSKDTDYDEVVARVPAFLTEFPDWTTYKVDNTPEFDIEKVLKSMLKKVSTAKEACADNDFNHVAHKIELIEAMIENMNADDAIRQDITEQKEKAELAKLEADDADAIDVQSEVVERAAA